MKKASWEKRLHTLLKIRLGNYYDQEAKYFGLWTALKQFISQELQREREEMGKALRETIKTYKWTPAHNSRAHNQQLQDILETITDYLERKK